MLHENKTLEPGVAFPLVKKLLALRAPDSDEPLVEVILLSRNSADTGLRIFNSIQAHNLNITRAVFTKGANPYHYVSALGAHVFLSANPTDVVHALEEGVAAATLFPRAAQSNDDPLLKIAFDGDAVLFGDQSEQVFQNEGLEAFKQQEAENAHTPLPAGPFKGLLGALHELQKRFPSDTCPLRTALITARDAPSHERVIRTLRSWNIRIDEAMFLGGLAKTDFLQAFNADIFFDDQSNHIQPANKHTTAAHVPHGVMNT